MNEKILKLIDAHGASAFVSGKADGQNRWDDYAVAEGEYAAARDDLERAYTTHTAPGLRRALEIVECWADETVADRIRAELNKIARAG